MCLKKEAESSAFIFMRDEMNIKGEKRKFRHQKVDERIEKKKLYIRNKYEVNADIVRLSELNYVVHKQD